MPHKVENRITQTLALKTESFTENDSKIRISVEPYPFISSISIIVDSDDAGDFEQEAEED